MTTNRGRLVAFFVLLCFLSRGACGRALCETPPADPGLIFNEANAKWALYQSTYLPKLQGTVRGHKSDGTVTFRFDIKNRMDSCLFMMDAVAPNSHRREVYVANRHYTFSLAKKDERGWLVDKLSLDPAQKVSPTGRAVQDIVLSRAAEQFVVSGKVALSELVNHPSFSVRAINNRTTADGLAVVRVEFGFKPYLKQEPRVYVPVESGTVILVPSQFWRILECDVTEKYISATKHWKSFNEVQLTDGGVPILRRSLIKTRLATDNGEISEEQYISDCDLRFEEEAFAGDFYLTAFGLPEPVGITPPSRAGSYIWFIVAAFGALALGFLLPKLKRRSLSPEPVNQ